MRWWSSLGRKWLGNLHVLFQKKRALGFAARQNLPNLGLKPKKSIGRNKKRPSRGNFNTRLIINLKISNPHQNHQPFPCYSFHLEEQKTFFFLINSRRNLFFTLPPKDLHNRNRPSDCLLYFDLLGPLSQNRDSLHASAPFPQAFNFTSSKSCSVSKWKALLLFLLLYKEGNS